MEDTAGWLFYRIAYERTRSALRSAMLAGCASAPVEPDATLRELGSPPAPSLLVAIRLGAEDAEAGRPPRY